MNSIKVSYEQVLHDYPEVVEEFLTSLKESNSISKNIELEKIKWFYTWGKFSKKAKSEQAKTLKSITIQNRMAMTYDQRLPHELAIVKVNITMEAGNFLRGDRVSNDSVLSELIIRYENELLKLQMMAEQKEFNEQHILNSIPEPNKEILDELIPPEVKAMRDKMNEKISNGEQPPNATTNQNAARAASYDLDDLLDKISDEGIESLSQEEKDFLKKQSNKS